MDTVLLYLALAETNMFDCIRSEKKNDGEKMKKTDCRDSFWEDLRTSFIPRTCSSVHKKHNKRDLDCSKNNLDVRRCYV